MWPGWCNRSQSEWNPWLRSLCCCYCCCCMQLLHTGSSLQTQRAVTFPWAVVSTSDHVLFSLNVKSSAARMQLSLHCLTTTVVLILCTEWQTCSLQTFKCCLLTSGQAHSHSFLKGFSELMCGRVVSVRKIAIDPNRTESVLEYPRVTWLRFYFCEKEEH